MGSLGQDVDVSNITYRNIYTVQSNQMVRKPLLDEQMATDLSPRSTC